LLVTGTRPCQSRLAHSQSRGADSSRAAKVLRLQSLALRMSARRPGYARSDVRSSRRLRCDHGSAQYQWRRYRERGVASPYVAPTAEVGSRQRDINTYFAPVIDAATHADAADASHRSRRRTLCMLLIDAAGQPDSVLNQPFVAAPAPRRPDHRLARQGRVAPSRSVARAARRSVPSRSRDDTRDKRAALERRAWNRGAISTRAMKLAQIFDRSRSDTA